MENISDVNATTWVDTVSEPAVLTVIYFWHHQCPWCLRLSPILYELMQEFSGKIRFFKLNVLESPANQEVASNFGIMSTPTLLFLCKGRPVGQIVGFVSKEGLEKGLNDILGRYQKCLSQSTELRPSYIV